MGEGSFVNWPSRATIPRRDMRTSISLTIMSISDTIMVVKRQYFLVSEPSSRLSPVSIWLNQVHKHSIASHNSIPRFKMLLHEALNSQRNQHEYFPQRDWRSFIQHSVSVAFVDHWANVTAVSRTIRSSSSFPGYSATCWTHKWQLKCFLFVQVQMCTWISQTSKDALMQCHFLMLSCLHCTIFINKSCRFVFPYTKRKPQASFNTKIE